MHFRIKWKGWKTSESTWEPCSRWCLGGPDAINDVVKWARSNDVDQADLCDLAQEAWDKIAETEEAAASEGPAAGVSSRGRRCVRKRRMGEESE